ncbi:MAG: mannose-1-phosphate guanylyltransferase [Planctomycetaceae bacterium]|nr:mannose-1-phosphate guanylyltransferase [Planctomycetaceae bacterium]
MLHAVIMAGGSGTRFWPLSKKATPKQLLNLVGEETMIQQTSLRCDGLIDHANTWVVTNAAQASATKKQLSQLREQNILIEPAARNTAPCVALAAAHLLANDPEAVMLVMPADHVISTKQDFQQGVASALELIEHQPDLLSLFGVIPDFPSTGFGYIERSEPKKVSAGRAYEVKGFREKPDRDVAQSYLQAGTFFWNCGIFLWKATTILDALRTFEPELMQHIDKISEAIGTDEYQQVLEEQFPLCPSISIDYAVLERAKNIAVIEAPFQWDDLGSWQALQRLHGEDESGNTIIGQHVGVETSGCVVRSSGDHLITTIGIKNCIIVHTPQATLVADKSDENSIKELIKLLKKQGLQDYL